MLTPFQISQAKAIASPSTSALPNQAMTPEQAQEWIKPSKTIQPKTVQNPVDEVIKTTEPGYIFSTLSKAGEAIKNTYTSSKEMFDTTSKEFEDPRASNPGGVAKDIALTGRTVLGATAKAVEGVGGVLTSVLPDWYTQMFDRGSKAFQDLGTQIGEKYPEISQIFKKAASDPTMIKVVDSIAQKVRQNPDAGPVFKDALETILFGILPEAGPKAGVLQDVSTAFKTGGKELLSKAKNVVEETTGKVKSSIQEAKQKSAMLDKQLTTADDLQKINEMISPKPTAKEAKLATEQGRVFKIKPELFSEGKTKVAATEQQANSVRTIYRLIPDAAKLDEPTLVGEIKTKISDLSNGLKPEMQKVPINESTVSKITKEWERIKIEQKNNAYTPPGVNIKKLQADFEKRLQKSKSGTMDDLWETRQAYDDSVPESVKRATEISTETLQAQKEIWLQNRSILTSAINDIENGLGDVSRQAFRDMRDLYEAKNGIISKAKIETKPTPSGLDQFGKTKIGRVLKTGAKVLVGEEIIRNVVK